LPDSGQFCGSCGAPLAPPPADDSWIGRVVDARYKVLARIGSGGMGVVYRVEHLRLGKTAAMKVLAPDTATKPEMVQRFRLEAQAVSKLSHSNIVQTFDFGQFESALYLIMEYVKGEDLAALLKREGALPFARAARIFAQACSALTEAHDHGIIHRDLKPENLMVHKRRDGSEHVKVLDFGLAKLRERDESAAVTTGKQILGTPYYMSPEQVRGERLDPRADVYSLGATLYRVLTGTAPFNAASPMGVLSKHVTDPVEPPRQRAPGLGIPPEAEEIVLRAMAKNVEERYASAAAVQADLERALGIAQGLAVLPTASARRNAEVAEAPTLSLEESAASGGAADSEGEALGRDDLRKFERGIKRRRFLTRLALPLLAVAVGVGTYAVSRWRTEKPVGAEQEPNNTPGYANLLASGRPVRGAIGALLELFDAQGRPLAKSDEHGRGGSEWLQPTSIGPGEAFLSVREMRDAAQKPTEDPDEPYVFTVTWGPPQTGWELEPNDWEASATTVPPGTSIRGYLGYADDKDWFAVTPATSGKLHVHVSVPAGVDVVLLQTGAGKKPLTINKAGPGEDEELVTDVEAGRAALIGVARKAQKKSPKDDELAGLDAPYELEAKLE
jgi:serine/threonine-protein kinase